MTINIKAEKREKVGKKADSLKKAGLIPAVFYGHKKESTPIQVNKVDFLKMWRNAGESTVIKLSLPEGEVEALIKEVDFEPLTGEPRHADFYVFEKGHKIEVEIPLEFVGVSPAVKDLGGTLMKVLHELKIKADPSNLPHEIEVDISSITELDGQILAKEIKLPTGVELIENPEEVVATVAAPKEEKEEESAPADLSSIEVEKKGKADEETGESSDSSSE